MNLLRPSIYQGERNFETAPKLLSVYSVFSCKKLLDSEAERLAIYAVPPSPHPAAFQVHQLNILSIAN